MTAETTSGRSLPATKENEMKLSKILGVAVVAALALMAFASTASATTLKIGGTTQNTDVTIKASLATGTSALLTDTFKAFANTCTSSTVEGNDSTKTSGTVVEGPITTLDFSSCTEGNPTTDLPGTLSVERIGSTINGTVRSNGAKVTVPSFFGTLTCTTSNTDIGTLTGTTDTTKHATMDINAVLSCTGIGTALWTGTYTVTSPTGLNIGA
jgi:hypothetical protein